MAAVSSMYSMMRDEYWASRTTEISMPCQPFAFSVLVLCTLAVFRSMSTDSSKTWACRPLVDVRTKACSPVLIWEMSTTADTPMPCWPRDWHRTPNLLP